jgi:hypothetical protein
MLTRRLSDVDRRDLAVCVRRDARLGCAGTSRRNLPDNAHRCGMAKNPDAFGHLPARVLYSPAQSTVRSEPVQVGCSASEILLADVRGGFSAQSVEVRLKPGICATAADVPQVREEPPISIELAENTEIVCRVIGRDTMDEKALHVVTVHLAFVDEARDEADRPHLTH